MKQKTKNTKKTDVLGERFCVVTFFRAAVERVGGDGAAWSTLCNIVSSMGEEASMGSFPARCSDDTEKANGTRAAHVTPPSPRLAPAISTQISKGAPNATRSLTNSSLLERPLELAYASS